MILVRKPILQFIILLLVFGCQDPLKKSRDTNLVLNNHIDHLKISYIGNMGVLLENDNKTVLIDGFHKKYKPAYLHPSEGMVNSLINGSYNGFTEIEISLVTHNHKDHFNPELSLRFLNKNKNSLVIGSNQVKEDLAIAENDTINFSKRIIAIDSDYKVHTTQHEEIQVKAIKCEHTYQARHSEIQNIAYLININGYKILHLGDTEWSLLKDTFEKLNVIASNIDVAILPSWMLTEESSISMLNKLIKPNTLLASHIDPNFDDQIVEEIQLRFPDAICLTEQNKIIKFNKVR